MEDKTIVVVDIDNIPLSCIRQLKQLHIDTMRLAEFYTGMAKPAPEHCHTTRKIFFSIVDFIRKHSTDERVIKADAIIPKLNGFLLRPAE